MRKWLAYYAQGKKNDSSNFSAHRNQVVPIILLNYTLFPFKQKHILTSIIRK